MVKIKNGVTPANLVIMAAVANAAQKLGLEVTITAGTNGKHMTTSKHYHGEALDIRSKNIGALKQAFLRDVMERLGTNYEGFLESPGTENEHFHIEYDPKD